MYTKINSNLGQSALELVLLVLVVTSAMYIIGAYIHRASNGRVKELMDSFGALPYESNVQETKLEKQTRIWEYGPNNEVNEIVYKTVDSHYQLPLK